MEGEGGVACNRGKSILHSIEVRIFQCFLFGSLVLRCSEFPVPAASCFLQIEF